MKNTLLKAGGVFVTFPQGLFFAGKNSLLKIGGVFVTFLAGAFFFAQKTPYSTPTQDPLLNSLTQVICGRSFNKILYPFKNREFLEKVDRVILKTKLACSRNRGPLRSPSRRPLVLLFPSTTGKL